MSAHGVAVKVLRNSATVKLQHSTFNSKETVLKGKPQRYGASPAIWKLTVLCHPTQENVPRLHHIQTGRYSIYLARKDGRLS